jgi:hypothetical protein
MSQRTGEQLKNCLVRQLLAGGVPGRGVVVGESKKSNLPSKPPGMYKNSADMASFPHFLPQKSLKMPFFT